MKYLNFIDLAFQTFVLGAAALLSLATAIAGSLESIGLIALYGAVFLGPWQMVSSLLTTVARGLYFKWRLIHLLSSVAYVAVLSVAASVVGGKLLRFEGIVSDIGVALGFAIPLVLALFYYYITVRSFQLSRTRSL